YVASAGSTAAGLLLGKAALGSPIGIRIVAPIRWPWDHATDLAKTANQAAELLDLSVRVLPADVDTTLDAIGPGYGLISPEGQEAFDLMARCAGILLDPVYTAKALAALIADVRRRRPLPPDQPIIFLHTGGAPALFAYHHELVPR
ncbi:MAG: pyridoxal-phosphate dependent enzyme, partial [Pirellulales bacterium]